MNTDAAVSDRPTSDPAPAEDRSRWRRLLVILLGPLWVRTFRDPVREGHLRLDALTRTEKQLARCGLVLLVLLLVSTLFSDVWRSGTLLQLEATRNQLSFLPQAVLPVTLLGFLLAWTLLGWGALDSSPLVRVVIGVFYLSTASTFTVASAGLGRGSWVLEHAGTLVKAGSVGPAGALLLSALLHPLVRSRPRGAAVASVVFRLAVVVGLLLQYGTLQWAQMEAQRQGLPLPVPGLVDGSIDQTNSYLVPLVLVAAVTVIDFALDVSTSLTEPAQVLSRRGLLLVLVAVLTVKIVVQVVLRWDEWTASITYQPAAFVRTVLCVIGLAVLVAVVTRFPASDDYQLAKERAMYGSSVVVASFSVLSVFAVGIGLFLIGQFDSDVGIELNDRMPYAWLGGPGLAIAGGLALLGGLWLMRRSAGGFGDELGSAVVVLGGWFLSVFGLSWLGVHPGFSYPVVDLVVTAGVLLLLLVRRRRLAPATLAGLTTLLVFSWLVMSRGDYLSFLGSLVGLPTVLVVVFGVALTLASGSAFASESSKRLPAEARPLLFVGYLLLSVVILHWLEVTHEEGQDPFSDVGFYVIGIPMAFWLAARRILVRHTVEPDEPAQVVAGRRPPTSTTPSTTSTS